MKPALSTFVELRGMRHRVLTWGDPSAPTIFMLHGWMDVGASFQFLVDAFTRDWRVVAPDLRGFGGSQWQPQGYWFYDYIADLEALVDHYSPGESIDLLGHSLGGNIVMQYAGVRPARVRRVVSLEGFGIPAESSDLAPTKVAKWLDALRTMPEFQPYTGLASVADRLQKNNSRLKREQAEFLAAHWAEATSDGARLISDPRHKLPFPIIYRMDEVAAIWRNVQAPTLWVAAAQTTILRWLERGAQVRPDGDGFDVVRQRLANIKDARLEIVVDAGHMLHHDQPAAVARLI
ncbi:MAG TPA: alpha/beta hydrolase, partial [Casimicrobiaceae bacterium]